MKKKNLIKYSIFLVILLVYAPSISKAQTVSEGTKVYYEDELSAQGSSRQVLHAIHWIGEVKRILKTGLIEVQPISKNGDDSDRPTIFMPIDGLSPAVNEYSGFKVGDFVTYLGNSSSISSKKSFATLGYILHIFSNGLAYVDWATHPDRGGAISNFISLDHLKIGKFTGSPLGLEVGQTVYFDKSIGVLPLNVGDKKKYHPISEISLGDIPCVGKVTQFSNISGEQGGFAKVVVTVEKENGRDLKVSKQIEVDAKELFREAQSNPTQQVGTNVGDSVSYSSEFGIKPYEFHGKIVRLFENSIAEVKWETKNGRNYKKAHLSYLPVKRLNWPLKSSLVSLNAHGLNAHGVDVLLGRKEEYLAIASIERALKKPDIMYLRELDRIVYDRANRICIKKGMKGLFSWPKVTPIKSKEDRPLYNVIDDRWVRIVDYPVSPWTFKVDQIINPKGKSRGRGLVDVGVGASAVGAGFGALMATSTSISTTLAFGTAIALGASAGFGIGAVVVPLSFLGIMAIQDYSSRITFEHAKSRLGREKEVSKTFEAWRGKIPSLAFSELFCVENEAEVLGGLKSIQIEDLQWGAQFDKIYEDFRAHTFELGQLYETSDDVE